MQECNLTGEEKFAFKVAKAREWGAWLDNRAIELILPHLAAKVDPKYVLGARWVLTWKKAAEYKDDKEASADRYVTLNGQQVKVFKDEDASQLQSKDHKADDEYDAKLKDAATVGGRVAKARLVLLGYQDPELASLATASPTLARSTRSILFALGAHRQWPVRTLDARAAFLAGDPHHARQRPLYMRLPAEWLQELQLQPGTLFKLLKAAYGLCEAPRAWFEKLVQALREVGFHQSASDPCCFSCNASL